jgi:hypothetical protein
MAQLLAFSTRVVKAPIACLRSVAVVIPGRREAPSPEPKNTEVEKHHTICGALYDPSVSMDSGSGCTGPGMTPVSRRIAKRFSRLAQIATATRAGC